MKKLLIQVLKDLPQTILEAAIAFILIFAIPFAVYFIRTGGL